MIKLPRMYTDAQRGASPVATWDISHWVDYVETGRTLQQRRARLNEAPEAQRHDIERIVARRYQIAQHLAQQRPAGKPRSPADDHATIP